MSLPILQLDIISDVICPWCFIGKRKLDMALQQIDDYQINLIWRPYQLDPKTPPEGYDRHLQMQRKFGKNGAQALSQKIIAASAGTNIDFAFEKITRTPNTLNAHRLIRWAGEYGAQHHIAEDLFQRYFEQGQDISDKAVLLEIAAAHNMNVEDIGARFETERDVQAIREDDAAARDMNVTGVPAFLVAGRFMMMGAQEPETLAHYFRRAAAKLAQ